MIDPAKITRTAEPASLRQGALSLAEAEGKKDEFLAIMRRDEGEGERGSELALKPESESESEPGSKNLEAGLQMRPKGETGKDETGKETGDPCLPPPFSGDALLRGMGSAYVPLETGAAETGHVQDTPALATELTERILVNTDNRVAGGEVRITLRQAVLPDTEIILRQEGERLVVQLVSGNPASLEALRSAQDDLRNKLLALDRDASVEVLDNRAREEERGSGHSGGRSRGLDYFTESER